MARQELIPGVSIDPKTVKTTKGVVEYDVTESDGPAVMMVHGGLGGCDQARLLGAFLDPKQYRIVSPSRPGYLGTPLESGKSMEEQADLLVALMDELKIDKAVAVGASAGGPPLYQLALRHPDRLNAIVAIDAVTGYYVVPKSAGPVTQAIFLSSVGQKIMKAISNASPKALLKSLFQAESCFTKELMQRHIDWVMSRPDMVTFIQAFMNTMMPYKKRKAGTDNDMEIYAKYSRLPVENISVPALIIHGTHDADVLLYDGLYAYEHIKGAERFWIEEGSHLGFYINPNSEKAQNVARKFIGRHAGGKK